ncbi:MAG: helix-hairpin-helix domain-containing protein [Chloroflexota bacterium]
MLKRLVYIGIGFAIGYLVDTLRRQQAGEFEEHIPAAKMEEIFVTPAKSKEVLEQVIEPKVVPEESSADFLTEINGIGPTYARRLFDGGIRSLQSLIDAGAGHIAEVAKLRNANQAEDWIVQASQLIAK